MTDVDTDYGEVAHVEPRAYDNGPRTWVDCLQDVLDEVTSDLRAANPQAKELGGIVQIDRIEDNVRPLVACTWLELTQVEAHAWLGPNQFGETHFAAWRDLLRSTVLSADHVSHPQVLHRHQHGQPCNRGCRLVRSTQTKAVS